MKLYEPLRKLRYLALKPTDLTTALSVDRGAALSALYAYLPFIIMLVTIAAIVAGTLAGSMILLDSPTPTPTPTPTPIVVEN